MKKSRTKLIISMIVLAIIVLVISVSVYAANDNQVKVVQYGDKYIIYVQGYEDKDFEFAFSNNPNEPNLVNRINGTDKINGKHVAFINAELWTQYFSADTYMWINGEQILGGKPIDKSKIIDGNDIARVDKITQTIKADPCQWSPNPNWSNIKIIDKDNDGRIYREEHGWLKIRPDGGKHYYQIKKVANEDKRYEDLFGLAQDINSGNYGDNTMFTKLDKLNTFMTLYDELESELIAGEWKLAKDSGENDRVNQPENADYVVWLANSDKTVTDAQFMVSDEETEEDEAKTTPGIPVTGEDYTLFIVFGSILAAVILMSIVVKRLSKQDSTRKTGKHS